METLVMLRIATAIAIILIAALPITPYGYIILSSIVFQVLLLAIVTYVILFVDIVLGVLLAFAGIIAMIATQGMSVVPKTEDSIDDLDGSQEVEKDHDEPDYVLTKKKKCLEGPDGDDQYEHSESIPAPVGKEIAMQAVERFMVEDVLQKASSAGLLEDQNDDLFAYKKL